jgi:small subunit ribosomal protein S1
VCPQSDAPSDDDDLDSPAPARSPDFARMLEESFSQTRRKLSVGDKVKGEVLVVGKEDVFVSTGPQAEGVVARRDLLGEDGQPRCKVGDVLDLFVVQVKGGEVRLSPNPTAKNLADDLEDAFDMMLPVEGKVVEVVKGGFRVQMHGKLAFCPVSQMDVKYVETPEEYVGRKLAFRITQFAEGGRNIVVSRRKVLEEEREASAGSFLEQHREGDVVPGRVARLEKFGAFVELAPGMDGLCHISELSWSRVAETHEAVQVGQQVRVKILKIEPGEKGQRISLSIKQADGEPWEKLPADVRPGNVVAGKVTRCAKFGAFVELAPGIEGLIPLSEMSYTKRVLRAEECVREGEPVVVMVKDVDGAAKRISLSLKDAGQDPWALVDQKYPVGAIVPGKVVRREGYGIFVQLEDGVTGLLPKSKAVEVPDFPFEKLKIGEPVTVQVAEVRREERRISLEPPGDANRDEWKSFAAKGAADAGGGFGTLGDKLKAALAGGGGKPGKK